MRAGYGLVMVGFWSCIGDRLAGYLDRCQIRLKIGGGGDRSLAA